jgi:hypothetical protein
MTPFYGRKDGLIPGYIFATPVGVAQSVSAWICECPDCYPGT